MSRTERTGDRSLFSSRTDMSKNDTHALVVYTPEKLAAMLGVTVKTRANWRSENRGPRYARLGNRGSRVVYREQEVSEWLEAQLVDTRYWTR